MKRFAAGAALWLAVIAGWVAWVEPFAAESAPAAAEPTPTLAELDVFYQAHEELQLPVYTPAALFPDKYPLEPSLTEPELAPLPAAGVVAAASPAAVVSALPAPAAVYLGEAEMREVLAAAGWPAGADLEEALSVSHGESIGWQPTITGDGGLAYGLFQIHADPWAGYCGIPVEALLTAAGNARCARLIFEYEQARGYPRWSNWTVKPFGGR
ncbi:MAG: hypothetical protein AB7I04_18325 [Pseudomonadales bacterium]